MCPEGFYWIEGCGQIIDLSGFLGFDRDQTFTPNGLEMRPWRYHQPMNAPLSVQQWLLAEHTRHQEEQQGRLMGDETANALALQQSEAFATRIADRALALPGAQIIQKDLIHIKKSGGWLVIGLLMVAALAGFGMAVGAVRARELEVLWVLTTVLGIPTLTLILWMLWLIFSSRSSIQMPLAKILAWLSRVLSSRLLHGPSARFTLKASLDLLATPYGRWGLSALSHLFWLMFLLAAVLLLTLQFMVTQYDLGWGTTLLSEQSALMLLDALAWLPKQLGWLPPDHQQWLAAGRLGEAPELVRSQWAHFLLVLMLVYGVLPRLMALGVSLILWRVSSQRMSLDLNQPGYVRLKGLLMPEPVPHSAPETRFTLPALPLRKKPASGRDVLLVALEHSPEAPKTRAIRHEVTDLGHINTRQDRARVLAALRAKREPTACLVVVCEARRTPDQGLVTLINQLADAAKASLVIGLSGIDELAGWGVDPSARMEDWQSVGEVTGARVVGLDALDEAVDEVMS